MILRTLELASLDIAGSCSRRSPDCAAIWMPHQSQQRLLLLEHHLAQRPSILLGPAAHTTHSSGLGSGPSAFGEQINGSGSMLSANRSMRCLRWAPIHAHQLPLSFLLPTTRKGRGSPKNELHLRHAVAKHHSLNQCVHFLQLGPLGRQIPTKVPHFGPQGVDFIGLTAPQHHRLPPSLTLRSAPCHNNAASPGLRYGRKSHTSCRQPPQSALMLQP
jgi:hypothetical protein